jgi:pimeloyl-ACP methyl ester carboxylesterase
VVHHATSRIVAGLFHVDWSPPQRYSEFLQAHIAGASLTLIPGAGHMVALEAPAATVAALTGL